MKKIQRLYKEEKYKDIKDLLEKFVNRFKNNLAFKLKKKNEYEEITYERFKNDIDSLQMGFISKGIKNKRIAVIGPNSYEWALTYFATLCSNNVLVPLDKGLPEGEIESLLQRSSADVVVFDEKYCDVMNKFKNEKTTNVSNFICMKKTEEFEYFNEFLEKGKQLISQGNTEYKNIQIDAEKMSIIIFTSGTTSISKAVMLSHKNIVENITALNVVEKVYETDVNLAFLPFHHAFGSTGLLFFLSNGACNVFCDGLKYIQKNIII